MAKSLPDEIRLTILLSEVAADSLARKDTTEVFRARLVFLRDIIDSRIEAVDYDLAIKEELNSRS